MQINDEDDSNKIKNMKTAEERAEKYANKKYQDSSEWVACYFGYMGGYAEAIRWRDPKVELPENQEIVLVKSDNGCYATAYCHGESGCFIDYGRDAYVDFGEIIGWRPIE